MRVTWLALALLALGGCGSDGANHGGGGPDLAVPDMAMPDLLTPTACSATDPMSDGTACSGGCPTGTVGVNLTSGCKCFATCTSNPECSCNRLCDTVTMPDAGVVGGACLPGNAPGQRCGRDPTSGSDFGNAFCGQLTACVNADAAKLFRYCSYKCTTQSDCPAQTTCVPLMDAMGNPLGDVCSYNPGPNGNKSLGQACTPSDVCQSGLLCDGTCIPQCDGPGATCAAGGSCTRLDDPATGKVVGYVCK
jgi:hypothetical protein